MAKKFKESKLQNLVNPLGILYSPESIIKLLAYSLGLEAFSENRISEWQGYFYYDDAHSEIYASSKEELRIKIEDKIEQLSSYLKEVDKIFLTFGTSFSYKKKSSGEFVANCHKQKASSFEKEMLSSERLFELSKAVFEALSAKEIIVSVSPIRHLRDGLLDSQLSKSNLRLYSDLLEKNFSNISYYPSYEVFMDELRDYRFYKEDMIHPTDLAVEYIWNYFKEDFLENSTLQTMASYLKLKKSLDHRPMKDNDPNYLKHLTSLEVKLKEFKWMNLDEEIEIVKKRIQSFN